MKLLFISLITILGTFCVSAQTAECPSANGCVLISREAALKAISDADTVKAQASQIQTLEKAVSDLKDELQKMRDEFIRASTESTALKQQQVRDAAIIELLLKYSRPKKFGVINF